MPFYTKDNTAIAKSLSASERSFDSVERSKGFFCCRHRARADNTSVEGDGEGERIVASLAVGSPRGAGHLSIQVGAVDLDRRDEVITLKGWCRRH